MKIFLDTANIDEIKAAKDLGFLDGITTNPTLISKECKTNPKEHILKICEIATVPISVEVVQDTYEGMVKEAKELAKISSQVVIKLPLTKNGLKAAKVLLAEDIKVNITLCFSPTQALFAAKLGATYVSPFIGRLDDISQEGMEIIKQIKTIFNNYNFKTQILVASIRHPIHVLQAALLGADCATMPFAVFEKLFNHPLTDIGLEKFKQDWLKTGLTSWNI